MEESGNSLNIHLLGQFCLNWGEQLIPGLETPRIQALLGYLIENRQAPLARNRLAFAFWPDSSEEQAQTNLRHLLHRLHTTWPRSSSVLATDQKTIWWHPLTPWTCDLVEFEENLLRASAARDREQEKLFLSQACELYTGEFLPGLLDESILHIRERLDGRFRVALERLMVLSEATGEYRYALRQAERLLGIDPLNEDVYRWLMHLHCRNGDRSGALHVFHQCSRIIYRELGVQPSALTQSIYEQVLQKPDAYMIPLITTEGLEPALVGRKEQWDALLACWRGVATGNGLSHCVVIKGEAGIGKTSLVQTFVHWVQHQGGTARMASCYRNEEMLPYNPVISWLRSFTLTGLPFFWLREIALIAPELVEFLPPNTQNLETGQRQKLFLALAHATLQQNQPILLALDDAQLADHYTLEWLLFLLHHNPRARLMIVLTRNINEISQDHPLFQMRPELQPSRRFTEISLKRLIRSDARLIADRLAGRPLAEHMLDLLYEFSEGNPFFIVEAIRAYGLAFGDTDSMGSAISESSLKQIPSVQALISRRLAHLSTDAQKILEAAAVMGHSFQADVILLASCIDEDTLLSGLEELWRRGLIIECDQQRFEFQHRLLRHYIYDGMSKSRRKYLHQRVSQALQEEYFS